MVHYECQVMRGPGNFSFISSLNTNVVICWYIIGLALLLLSINDIFRKFSHNLLNDIDMHNWWYLLHILSLLACEVEDGKHCCKW